ncbi:hypothetical protein F5B21DRAFT_505842 [Xylaria acuta]|nr:hypothetical protein F5B21DRAFT_505842 [Xylaria acuta]
MSFAVDKAKYDALDKRVKDLRKLDDGKRVIHVDVLIVGSGPIGAVYSRTLIDYQGQKDPNNPNDPGFRVGKVLMVDMGAQCVPTCQSTKKVYCGNYNPQQKPEYNIKASAATRVVGGMSTHWTGCTPRQHPLERSKLFNDDEWKSLYEKCEALFHTSKVNFENSVRQRLVKYVLKDKFQKDFEHGHKKPWQTEARAVKTMPLAAKQLPGNESYIEWSCTATILGDLANPKPSDDRFMLMSQTQCDVLQINPETGRIECAIIVDLVHNKEYVVKANKYAICGGAVLTAGIIAKSALKSGLKLNELCPALGKYMTEQAMTFCQVILKQDLIDDVKTHLGFLDEPNEFLIKDKVTEHTKNYPDDPVPFPFDDPDPQVYTPFSGDYPWHTQIYRDAFRYVELPPDVDPRLVVELRFFGLIESREANKITWDIDNKDAFSMLQPTFWFEMTDHDKSQTAKMKKDMTHIAKFLGDFIPGVVSREGKVWTSDNLYLGGCGIIPVSNASNPTLTAACYALTGARQIAKELEALMPTRNK